MAKIPSSDSSSRNPERSTGLKIRDVRNRGELQFLGFISLGLIFLLQLDQAQSVQKIYLQSFLIGLVILLLATSALRSLPKALEKGGHYSKRSKNPKKWMLTQSILAITSIFFLLIWTFVTFPYKGRSLQIELIQYEPFLHMGMLVASTTFLMGLRRVYFYWKIFDMTPGRLVFLVYGVAALLGAVILNVPFCLQEDKALGLVDGIFIAVSAMTLTGLSPVNISETFSMFGLSIIALLIQIGGIGIIVISVSLASLIRRRLSLSLSLLGQNELFDMPDLGGMKVFVTRVLAVTFLMEIVGTIFMYFQLPADLDHRFFHAVFHSIASFCNAGFSSFSHNLDMPGLMPFKITSVILVFIANFGFLVISDMWNLWEKPKGRKRLKSDTVLTIHMTFIMYAVGIFGILACESFSGGEVASMGERVWHSVFYSVSGKTSGFNISSVADLTSGSLLVLSIIMVVGGASLSTAGGIKVSTAGVLLSSALSLFRGHKWIEFRKAEIPFMVLQKAVAIIIIYFSVLMMAIIALIVMENIDPMEITFEMISAFSTVGLSLGVTEKVGAPSKMIMVLLMLTGRLGVISIAFVGLGKVVNQRFRYAKDNFFVG